MGLITSLEAVGPEEGVLAHVRRRIHHLPNQVVLQMSIPSQIRQLILYISNSKGHADGFVGELTSAKRLSKHFVRD